MPKAKIQISNEFQKNQAKVKAEVQNSIFLTLTSTSALTFVPNFEL
jgi:hypothetical protein